MTKRLFLYILLCSVGIFVPVKLHAYHNQLAERFPQFDRKVIRKAFRQMLREALSGKMKDKDTSDNAVLDREFLRIAHSIRSA